MKNRLLIKKVNKELMEKIDALEKRLKILESVLPDSST